MKNNALYLIIINIIILLCFLMTISCTSAKQNNPEKPNITHDQMLQGLGIVTDMDDLTDPDGIRVYFLERYSTRLQGFPND